jgi:hypothetical protein
VAEPEAHVGKMLVLPPHIFRLEEPNLPQQLTRERELDRDHRLEELNGDVQRDFDDPKERPTTLVSLFGLRPGRAR